MKFPDNNFLPNVDTVGKTMVSIITNTVCNGCRRPVYWRSKSVDNITGSSDYGLRLQFYKTETQTQSTSNPTAQLKKRKKAFREFV